MIRLSLALAAVLAAAPVAAQTKPAPLIAQGCAGCHGQSGTGGTATPPIAGLDRAVFVQVWGEFRANQRPATIMNRIARGYTDAELAQLADYFSSLR